ncbi:MAG: hypothetical protein IT289_05685 [Oligoflexia bacterium]|nr:hypothetical protein [Oligoflexia bacterium]
MRIPEPPSYLIREPALEGLDFTPNQNSEPSREQILEFAETEQPLPKKIDSTLFKAAVEDRKRAEIQAAEIYSQYLEVVKFNEKLLKAIGTFDRYQRRVRAVYNNAKRGDLILASNLQEIQRNLVDTERTLSDLQIENETLRIAIQAHEDAFRQVTNKLGLAESTMDQANLQFVALSEEFDRRGKLLEEASLQARQHITQIEQLGAALLETNSKYDKLRDECMILSSQLREAQIKEAGVSALNQELTTVVTQLQKQLHGMEAQFTDYRNHSEIETSRLKAELERLRQSQQAQNLVEKSQVMLSQTNITRPKAQAFDRAKLDEFMGRWNRVMDEMSAASSTMKARESMSQNSNSELLTESGDIL